MSKLLKTLKVFLFVLKTNVFSACCEVAPFAVDDFDKVKPLTQVTQQGFPVTLRFCGHEYLFACATAAKQMQQFYGLVELLSPRNSSRFLHQSIPASSRADLPRDHTRDGFVLATYSFVMTKISGGTFDGVFLTINEYVQDHIARIGSQMFGLDIPICLNKYGFLRAFRMHLDGKSLSDVAGFLTRANLVYGTDQKNINKWLRNRPGLPNTELVASWHAVSLRFKTLTAGSISDIDEWIEDGAD